MILTARCALFIKRHPGPLSVPRKSGVCQIHDDKERRRKEKEVEGRRRKEKKKKKKIRMTTGNDKDYEDKDKIIDVKWSR